MEKLRQKELLSPREVANLLSVAKSTVYYWITTGRLEAVKLPGKTLRIRRSAVEDAQKSTLN